MDVEQREPADAPRQIGRREPVAVAKRRGAFAAIRRAGDAPEVKRIVTLNAEDVELIEWHPPRQRPSGQPRAEAPIAARTPSEFRSALAAAVSFAARCTDAQASVGGYSDPAGRQPQRRPTEEDIGASAKRIRRAQGIRTLTRE